MVKFWYVVRDSISHIFTVGILEIIFMEGDNGITRRPYKWRLQSLLILSNVWESYQSNQRRNLWNLKKLLEMPLSLLEHTWAHLEVSDEFIAIGVRMNMCRDPWGLNWVYFGMFIELKFFLYDYKYNIVVFYVPIDVLIRIDR